MPRVKRGVIHLKKRKRLLKSTKGYKWGRKKLIRQATEAAHKAGVHAFTGRKTKKRINRRLWLIRLNAALKNYDLNYSKFIHLLKVKNIILDRKILSTLAQQQPLLFEHLIKKLKK